MEEQPLSLEPFTVLFQLPISPYPHIPLSFSTNCLLSLTTFFPVYLHNIYPSPSALQLPITNHFRTSLSPLPASLVKALEKKHACKYSGLKQQHVFSPWTGCVYMTLVPAAVSVTDSVAKGGCLVASPEVMACPMQHQTIVTAHKSLTQGIHKRL